MTDNIFARYFIYESVLEHVQGIKDIAEIIEYDYLWWDRDFIFISRNDSRMVKVDCNLELDSVDDFLQKVARAISIQMDQVWLISRATFGGLLHVGLQGNLKRDYLITRGDTLTMFSQSSIDI